MQVPHFPDIDTMVATLRPSEPVYCFRPAVLWQGAAEFRENFMGRVLYAVKCNPHPVVLRTLADAGIRDFDTASLAEIAAVRELIPDATAYFMHPVKSRAAIREAYIVHGVRHFVIDHGDELAKIAEETNGADDLVVLVRIATPGGAGRYELSRKFGATLDDAVELLRQVDRRGFTPGLAFHVGSQCFSPDAYYSALLLVDDVADGAGIAPHYLDIGGGFPVAYAGEEPPPRSEYFRAIAEGLEQIALAEDCVVMCEPGRALVAEGCSLVVQVQLRKNGALFINDGVYHSLSETVSAGIRHPVRLVRPEGETTGPMQEFAVYGPTCDGTDLLPYSFMLPEDTREGDWIEISQIGAYSNALASRFNGFHPEICVTVD